MTTTVDITNRALQAMGTRTTIASLSEQSNEAIQANLVLTQIRDQLLRMAPWNCARNYANLTLITATPGTPENTTSGTTTWQKGIPPPPWAYEYQYPVDCLRPIFVIPQFTTGFASGVPITTAVTGGGPSFWLGPPQKFQVSIDQFIPVTLATIVSGGSGYVLNDQLTLTGTPSGAVPIGAPAVLQVNATAGGVITSIGVLSQVFDELVVLPSGGSYFAAQTNPVAQGSTTGVGIGATFNLTFGTQGDQRVILTNQESATLCYVRRVVDPNVMDAEFQEAWVSALAARLSYQLTGDKAASNMKIQEANALIVEARKADANEGLTVNDITPDFIRARGIYYPQWEISPNVAYEWGPLLTAY